MNTKIFHLCFFLFLFLISCSPDKITTTPFVPSSGKTNNPINDVSYTGIFVHDGQESQFSFIPYNHQDEEGPLLIPSFAAVSVEFFTSISAEPGLMFLYVPERPLQGEMSLDPASVLREFLETGTVTQQSLGNETEVYVQITNAARTVEFLATNVQKWSNATYTLVSDSEKTAVCDCWYWDTYVNGALVQSIQLFCNCPCDEPESSVTCGNSDGGSGVTTDEVVPPNCSSFPYEPDVSVLHNAVGVNNVRFYYSHFYWTDAFPPELQYYHAEYTFSSTLYFTAPLSIDRDLAAENTAEAVHRVNQRLEETYGSSGLPSGDALEAAILSMLNSELGSWGASVGLTYNGALSYADFSETWWFPFDCN